MKQIRTGKEWYKEDSWPKGLKKRRSTGMFYFGYRESGKQKEKSLGVTDLMAAIKITEEFRKEVERQGSINFHKYTIVKLDDLFKHFSSRQEIKKNTAERHGEMYGQFKKYLAASLPKALDDVRLITPAVIESYKKWRQATPMMRNGYKDCQDKEELLRKCKIGASASTINQELGLLKRIFWEGSELMSEATNPFERVTYIKAKRSKEDQQLMSEDQAKRFLEVAKRYDDLDDVRTSHGDYLWKIFFTYLNTGMRDSELRYLEWNDINFDESVITIQISKRATENRKSDITRRSIRASEFLKEKCSGLAQDEKIFAQSEDAIEFRNRFHFTITDIDELMSLTPNDFDETFTALKFKRKLSWSVKKEKMRLIPMTTELKSMLLEMSQNRKSNFVFPDSEGGVIRWKIREKLMRITKEIGCPHITEVHSLRRTFATTCRKKGMAIETLQELLGHTRIEQTLRDYAKYNIAEGKKQIACLNGVF
ncbi:MAG: tyrosine-type recombinase/integrase [Planctomycetes bacterium]|nr:tyrosine-type recombinase/integrase [Planctomycetota bacterium]